MTQSERKIIATFLQNNFRQLSEKCEGYTYTDWDSFAEIIIHELQESYKRGAREISSEALILLNNHNQLSIHKTELKKYLEKTFSENQPSTPEKGTKIC